MFCVALNFPPLLSHSRHTRSSKGAKQKERRQIDLHAWSSIDLRPRRSKTGQRRDSGSGSSDRRRRRREKWEVKGWDGSSSGATLRFFFVILTLSFESMILTTSILKA
jgi:hypothetical protein